MEKLRSKIVHSKIFIQRSMSWISILNGGMLLFLVLSQLEKYGIDLRIEKLFFPIFLVTLVLMVLFGYIEDKLGFFKEEIRANTKRNPYMQEIIQRLKKIEKKLEKK